jgi:hypothetical protein
MVLCPIAIAVGCKRCPVFSACPVKSVIGDYKPGERPVDAAPSATPARPRPRNAAAKPKPAGNRKGARARRPRK